MAQQMINSLRKFHSEEELPVIIITGDDLKARLTKDPAFFYRATPVIAKELLEEYELVLKLDADQVVMGSLDFVLNSKGWDVGTVINYNRVDPAMYGLVSVASVPPEEYYNAGFVAMRSKEFVEHWHNMCFTQHFDRLQYREQDLLNILCHYGIWKVKSFDEYDPVYEYAAWHGLLNKGEGLNMKISNGEVILPKGKEDYPTQDVKVKVYHYAGGGNEPKNHRLYFNEELIKHIDWLISDGKQEKTT